MAAAEFINDYMPGKGSQRRKPAVPSIGGGGADAAQARYIAMIENSIVSGGVEETAGDIEAALAGRYLIDKEVWVGGAVGVAGLAAKAAAPRQGAEDFRCRERRLAENFQIATIGLLGKAL